MSAPPGGTGQHKERGEHRGRNPHQVIGDRAEPIQVGEHALGLPHHRFQPLGDAVHGEVAGGFSQFVGDLLDDGIARIADGVDRMTEADDHLFLFQARANVALGLVG